MSRDLLIQYFLRILNEMNCNLCEYLNKVFTRFKLYYWLLERVEGLKEKAGERLMYI